MERQKNLLIELKVRGMHLYIELRLVCNQTWEVDQTIILWQNEQFDNILGKIELYYNFEPLHNSQSPMSAIFEIPQYVA